jgi:hypothetical protein
MSARPSAAPSSKKPGEGIPRSDDQIGTRVAAGQRPRRFSAAELSNMNLPPARFIVDDYVPVGLTLLASRSKMGKSWLALHLGLSVAAGRAALGKGVDAGDVLYLALEDTDRRLKKRMDQMCPGRNWPKNLDFWTEGRRFDTGGFDEIVGWLDAHSQAKLVIIDTWAKVAPQKQGGTDDYTYLTKAFSPLQEVAFARNIGVLVIHHTRKPVKDEGDVFDTVLGTTAFTSVADCIHVLRRERGTDMAVLHTTGRDVEEREMAMQFDGARGLWIVQGNAQRLALSEPRRKLLEHLEETQQSLTPKEIADALDLSHDSCRHLLRGMAGDGLVVSANGSYSAKPIHSVH